MVEQIISILHSGGVILYPTDSVYAFGALANQKKAVEKIISLKTDDKKNRLFTIMCSDISHVSGLSMPIDNAHFKLLKKNTPGPFTFILRANKTLPKLINSKRQTIGIRIPQQTLILDILRSLGEENIFVSTSVERMDDMINPFYFEEDELIDMYDKRVDAIILSETPPFELSTVVDLTDNMPEILRQGKAILLPS